MKLVRQSLPFGGLETNGLFFIAYVNNLQNVEQQLIRMIGNDGPQDGILQFSKAVSGNYWYVPSVEELKFSTNV